MGDASPTTGPGVPAEDRERVQGRFVRLDSARTSQGSGLGLAIVAACAKLHDGRLVLEDNEPGLRAILKLTVLKPWSGSGNSPPTFAPDLGLSRWRRRSGWPNAAVPTARCR